MSTETVATTIATDATTTTTTTTTTTASTTANTEAVGSKRRHEDDTTTTTDAKKSKQNEIDAVSTTTAAAADDNKLDATLAAKILKQIDFYFGDSNFPRDNFLKGEAAKDVDGYVAITTLLTFNRLKALTQDPKIIARSIGESDVVEVDSSETRLRRRHAVGRIDSNSRTIYSKPYPKDTQWEAIELFWSQIGPVAATRLRRDENHKFKGSVFVEFRDVATAEKAVAANPSFGGATMITMTKKDYIVKKQQEFEEKSAQRKAKKAKSEGGTEASPTDKPNNDDDNDANDDKQQTKKDDADVDNDDDKDDDNDDKNELKYTKGCIVTIKGVGKIASRDTLQMLLEPFGDIQYVDYGNDSEFGHVRFASPDSANACVVAFADGKRELFGKVATVTLMTGDEEHAYWKQILERGKSKAANRPHRGRGRGGRRGGGRGGRGRGQKRQRD